MARPRKDSAGTPDDKPKRKPRAKKPNMSPEEEMLPLLDDPEMINALIKEAASWERKLTRKQQNELDAQQAIVNTLGEFLDSFIIIGFDYNNDPFNILFAKTQKDREAINSYFIKVFSRYMAQMHQQGDYPMP